MIVQHNMTSLNANRQLGITNKLLANSTEKLSSGYRVNRAADDAAGLSISEKMRGQVRGLNQASANAQDGQSLIQTAEGALNEIHSIIQRMRELTVQAANDTNVTGDRKSIALELAALSSEIDRIAGQTEFNTMKLLSGSFKSKWLQVGANSDQQIVFSIANMSSEAIGIDVESIAKIVGGDNNEDATVDKIVAKDTKPGKFKTVGQITGKKGTGSTISKLLSARIDRALSMVSVQRSKLGALQNRLDHTIANADNSAENIQASESKIRDVDMAKEMVTFSAKSILQQAGQSMLAQANQATQGVVSLLR